MFKNPLHNVFLAFIFSIQLAAQTYDVLPISGRNELFHNYLLEELDSTTSIRKQKVENALISKEKMQKRQKELRTRYLELLGDFPAKTPLHPVITGTINSNDGYTIEKLHFQSIPNHHVTANFYIPTEGDGPYPTVLILSGHYPIAKTYVDYQSLCISLAKNGMAVLIVDPICQGERYQVTDSRGNLSMLGQSGTGAHSRLDVGSVLTGTSMVAYELWDNHRAVDYLYSRTDVVDTTRIGCTGHSGGGAQATYLLAFDERIKAGTVANFITNESSMFKESGPQTGSQNLSYEGANGIDQPDYVTLFAPKPLLMIGTTTDAIFKINAARQTLDEAKKVYHLWDADERVGLFITTDVHDYTLPKRIATVEWYKKWFFNEEDPVTEVNQTTLPQPDLTVTSTGQVYTEFEDEKNITDLNVEKAEFLESSRKEFWGTTTHTQKLDHIRSLLKYESLEAMPENVVTAKLTRENYSIEKSRINYQNHVPVTALTFVPDASQEKLPAVLYVDGRGKGTDADQGGIIEELYLQSHNPHIVMSIDVRGFGETADNPSKNESKHNNLEHRNGVISLYLGKTLVGQRVQDIDKAMQILCNRPDVDTAQITIIGVDRASVAVIHAAALDKRFKNVIIRRASETPWMDAVTNPNIKDQMTHEVPSVLKYYTLPDLIENTLKNRNVFFVDEPFKGVSASTRNFNSNRYQFKIYPNPFLQKTTISCIVDLNSHIKLNIFNCNGEMVKSIQQWQQKQGVHIVELDATDFSNGLYLSQFIVNERPMALTKMWVKK